MSTKDAYLNVIKGPLPLVKATLGNELSLEGFCKSTSKGNRVVATFGVTCYRGTRPLQLSASDHARSKKASLDCALDLPDPVSNLGERRCSDVDQWTSCVDPNSTLPSEKPVSFGTVSAIRTFSGSFTKSLRNDS